MYEFTIVSMAGVALYCLAALMGLIASNAAKRAKRPISDALNWLFVAAMFVLFAALRGLQIEDWIEFTLRATLRSEGFYHYRRTLQAALAIGLAAFGTLGLGYWIYKGAKVIPDRCAAYSFYARVACFAMVGLICLRLVSHHTIDMALYRFKANWIGDVGSTVFVIIAAGLYLRQVRDMPAQGSGPKKVRARRSQPISIRHSRDLRR